MSAAKHTPGPWAVDEPHQVWAEAAGEYVAITQVEDFETIPREQVEANARLIAAAPDLLAALQLLLASHDATCPGEECQFCGVDLARAAIAKAEGA